MQGPLSERAAPRYTSYPTTPNFTAAVTAETYAQWLGALEPGAAVSLYLHVPFCREICHYCGCHTKAVRRPEPVDAYAESLIAEIALVSALSGSRRVARIHWGGGTPSMLGEHGLMRIAEALDAAFDLSDLDEHAIELDPRSVTPWLSTVLAGIGVDRVSLGVQDLAPDVQAAIGRIQPPEIVRHAVACVQDAGIQRLNFDLMYGLPRQTAGHVRRNAAIAAALRPQRIALFGYAHVPWLKPHQRLIDERSLPRPAERLWQAEAARETLLDSGYEPVGLDHFALPGDELTVAARAGRLRRNFQGYTADASDALIGFGASAISRLPQGYAQNAPDAAGYARAIAAGMPATAKGFRLSAEDRLRGRLIERLMCGYAVDLAACVHEAGACDDVDLAYEQAAIAEFERDGMVAVHGGRIAVTAKGRPFVRLIAAVFDAYLRQPSTRHSIAV